MSFRETEQTGVDVIRTMRDDIERLQRDMGSVRQNSIRLGNWVIEADGNRLKFYNTVTKEEHGFGGRERWSFADVVDTDDTYIDGQWINPPHDITITRLTITLQKGSSRHTEVKTMVNDVEKGQSAILEPGQTKNVVDLAIDVHKTDKWYPRLIAPGGDGEMLAMVYEYDMTINTPNQPGVYDYLEPSSV